MKEIIKNYRFEIITILIVGTLYVLNKLLILPFGGYKLLYFRQWYFSDLLAPAMLLSILIIIYGVKGMPKLSYFQMCAIVLIAGCFWEFIVPTYKFDSIGDINDLACYAIGFHVFYLLRVVLKFYKKYEYLFVVKEEKQNIKNEVHEIVEEVNEIHEVNEVYEIIEEVNIEQ